MWLLDKMLRKVIRTGELLVIDHDGKEYRYGTPAPGRRPVKARLTDKGAALHIAKDPRVGAGEAYMDGRLVMVTMASTTRRGKPVGSRSR